MIRNIPICGVNLIKEFESFSAKAYADPLTGGKPITIGWGSIRDLNGNPFQITDVISLGQGDILLHHECEEIMKELIKIPFFHEMSNEQIGALLSFAYNLGKNFYGNEGFQTITRRLKNKEWEEVPNALLLYVNPGTNVTAGLKRRRIAEGELWKKGLPKKDNKIITAKVATFLKKKTIQSKDLSPTEKVSVPAGKQFAVLSISSAEANHSLVDLPYNQGTWFIYNSHWVL